MTSFLQEYAERVPNKALRQVTQVRNTFLLLLNFLIRSQILGANVDVCAASITNTGLFPPVPPARGLEEEPTHPPFHPFDPPGRIVPRVAPSNVSRSVGGRILVKKAADPAKAAAMDICDSMDQYELPQRVGNVDDILGDETFDQLMDVLAELKGKPTA